MQNETKYTPLNDYRNYAYIQDLDVASMLVANQYLLESLDRPSQNKVIFIFRKEPPLEQDVDDFLSGRLSVNALAFSNARKNLKSRIYANKTIQY